jgi:5-methylcytosine-specific restriction protein A
MPFINKPTKKHQIKTKNINHKLIYNTKRWRELRIRKLMLNPLCELCLKNEIYTAAIEVHHIKNLNSETIPEQKIKIGFDINNLMSLCAECHTKIHNKKC